MNVFVNTFQCIILKNVIIVHLYFILLRNDLVNVINFENKYS